MTRFAYLQRVPASPVRVGTPGIAAAVLVAFAQLACSAGIKPNQTGSAGTIGSGTGGTSALAGTTGSAGTGSSSGTAGTTGSGNTGGTTPTDGGACQQAEVMFVPKIPTVYLLVDRSGSMFHCLTGNTGDAVCSDMTNTSWANLKTAMESVMTQLDGQVRFGFSTIYGTNPVGGGSCPSLTGMLTDNVAPALNNATMIKGVYDKLTFPPNSTQMGIKFESPASESIASVAKALTADTTPGDKFIIFLTDGQPDYCDDSNSLCAPDSVIYQLQKAYTAGIKTIVLGVQTALFDLAPGVLQAFANAGAGEPTLPPVKANGTTFDFYDQCASVDGWKADLTASGQTPMRGDTLGVYGTTMGPSKPFTAMATDQSQLVGQLSAALAGVKSCTFDLSNVGGKAIKVSLDKLGKASVVIQGTTVPLDANNKNGWDMTSDTVLELFGPACDAWRDPNVTDIKFNFPCDIIIS